MSRELVVTLLLWSIPIYVVLEMLDWLLRKYKIDCTEGSFLPERWISFGWIHPMNGGVPSFRYFCLKLPSWTLSEDFSRPPGNYRWFQHALFWFEPFGWKVTNL